MAWAVLPKLDIIWCVTVWCCVVFSVVLLDTATSESLDWVTHSSGDEDVVGRRGVRHRCALNGHPVERGIFTRLRRCIVWSYLCWRKFSTACSVQGKEALISKVVQFCRTVCGVFSMSLFKINSHNGADKQSSHKPDWVNSWNVSVSLFWRLSVLPLHVQLQRWAWTEIQDHRWI